MGLKYRTEWVELPDIKPVLRQLGAPTSEHFFDEADKDCYSLPAIYDPNTKTYVSDSTEIVKYLDKTYPDTPRLYPEGTDALQHGARLLILQSILFPLLWIMVGPINQILNPRSQEYWRKTREAKLGKKLEECGTEDDWKALEAGLGMMRDMLDQNGEGKDMLFMGKTITQADIQLAAVLQWTKVVLGEESQGWKRISSLHGGKWALFLEQFADFESVDG